MQGNHGLAVRGAYRARQFWQAIRAGPLPDLARREANQMLSDEQMALFLTQSEAGQQHSYRVMVTLVEAGYDQDDLLIAALLHDVGKVRMRYTWLDRVKVVLTDRIAPAQASRWADGPESAWTRAYMVKVHHPQWGADELAAAGGSDLSVALVRRHQESLLAADEDNEENRLLALLQWADDQN